jgi:hypothetical protein
MWSISSPPDNAPIHAFSKGEKQMNKTIQDIFTDEEWKLLAGELLPVLQDIAQLPIPGEQDEVNGHEI